MTPLIDYIHTTDYTPCYGSYSMAICCWLVAICDVDVSCHVVGVYVYIYIYIRDVCWETFGGWVITRLVIGRSTRRSVAGRCAVDMLSMSRLVVDQPDGRIVERSDDRSVSVYVERMHGHAEVIMVWAIDRRYEANTTHTYIYIHICKYIYIYIYIQRERNR